MESSTIQKNAGAGVMLGSGNRLTGNCLRDNGQYGFNAYHADGVRDVVLDGNEISGNNTDDWEKPAARMRLHRRRQVLGDQRRAGHRQLRPRQQGSRPLGGLQQRRLPLRGQLHLGQRRRRHHVRDQLQRGDPEQHLVRNALVKGPTNPGFPASAIYLSESGSDTRVEGPYGEAFRVSGNVFIDNWSGIVAWENADRFAGSPANTSTGVRHAGEPQRRHRVGVCDEVEDQEEAVLRRLPVEDPERPGGRQRLRGRPVEDPCLRAPRMAVASTGSSRTTAPIRAGRPTRRRSCEKDITFKQNNVWRNNTYTGAWHFMVEEAGKRVTWDAWRSAPYDQDAGSSHERTEARRRRPATIR